MKEIKFNVKIFLPSIVNSKASLEAKVNRVDFSRAILAIALDIDKYWRFFYKYLSFLPISFKKKKKNVLMKDLCANYHKKLPNKIMTKLNNGSIFLKSKGQGLQDFCSIPSIGGPITHTSKKECYHK